MYGRTQRHFLEVISQRGVDMRRTNICPIYLNLDAEDSSVKKGLE